MTRVSSITGRASMLAAVCGLAIVLGGCGGGKTAEVGDNGIGQTHHDDTSDFDAPENDPIPQTGPAENLPDAGASASNGGDPDDPDDPGDSKKPKWTSDVPVTFRLTNSGDEDLSFSMDKGWQPIIFAYSGEPPNAVSILMFPKHCTASCNANNTCPYCPKPMTTKEIKAAEKWETVKSGDELDVEWDAQVHVYQKVKKNCDCYTMAPVPAETYTVKACGLRLTDSNKKSSVYQCVESSMTFPAKGAQLIELDFPNPVEPEKE